MADQVLFETDDDLDESNLRHALTRSNVGDYVEDGLGFTYDSNNVDLDIGAGTVVVQDGTETYVLIPDKRENQALTDNAVNYVFIDYDPTADNDAGISYHIDTDDSAPSSKSLKVGKVDTSTDTVTELNREPDVNVHDETVTGDLTVDGTTTLSGQVDQTALKSKDVTLSGNTNPAAEATVENVTSDATTAVVVIDYFKSEPNYDADYTTTVTKERDATNDQLDVGVQFDWQNDPGGGNNPTVTVEVLER